MSEEPAVRCGRIDIPHDGITVFVGPNGSDKGALLESLAKQLLPDSGSVYPDGKSISEYDDKALAHELGMLPQQYDPPTSPTIEDLVYHGRYPHRSFFEQVSGDDHEAVEHIIDLTGIEHTRSKQIDSLSGGQSQLAWVVMVFAQDTDVLLLGEPTTYLDLHHQLRVLETVRQLNKEHDVTVTVILYDIVQAARFVNYLVAMQGDKLYDWEPSCEVVTEELLADVSRVEAAVSYSSDPRTVPRRSL